MSFASDPRIDDERRDSSGRPRTEDGTRPSPHLDAADVCASAPGRGDPGSGAAGGLAAGVHAFCKAHLLPGAKLMTEITDLPRQLDKADIVLTGEGRTDAQSFAGKLCSQVANKANNQFVPVILISGALERNPETLQHIQRTYTAAFSILHEPSSLGEIKMTTESDLYHRVLNIARLLKIQF